MKRVNDLCDINKRGKHFDRVIQYFVKYLCMKMCNFTIVKLQTVFVLRLILRLELDQSGQSDRFMII